MKDWTGLFWAWLQNGFDGQVIEVRMGTVWEMPADIRIHTKV